MKLFLAHHQRYPEDLGFYPAISFDELFEFLAREHQMTVEYIKEKFIYEELKFALDKDGKKWSIKLEPLLEQVCTGCKKMFESLSDDAYGKWCSNCIKMNHSLECGYED